MKKLFTCLLTLFLIPPSFGATSSDTLNMRWTDQQLEDSTRANSLYSLIWNDYIYNQPDTAFKLARQLYFFSQKKRLEKLEYESLRLMGFASYYTDRYKRALRNFKMYLDYHMSKKNMKEVGDVLHLIGMTKVNQGDLSAGLDYYRKSLSFREELNDEQGMAATLNNIGNIYYELEDWDKCLEYFERALVYKMKGTSKRAIANAYNNIGLVWHERGNLDSALTYYTKSLKIQEEINNLLGQIYCYNNIGALHQEEGRLAAALVHFKVTLKLSLKVGNYTESSNSYANIADVYKDQNQLDSALKYSLQSLEIAREIGSVNFIELATGNLYNIYKRLGESKLALQMHEEHIAMRDSLQSEKVKKGLLELQVKHEIEKEELEEEQRQKEAEQALAEKMERRNSLEYSGITVGLFILFGLLFIVGRFHLPKWAIELASFLPFLILFEFILVLSDPTVDSFAAGHPMIKLLINALIAGLIFPLHTFFERALKRRVFHGQL